MNTETIVSLDSKAWLKWTLATATGLFITDFLSLVVNNQFPFPILAVLDILATGLIIGALQWLFVLRPEINKSQRWLWVTAIGWAIGWVAGNLFGSLWFLSLFVHGVILGFSQWFFFMRNLNPKSFSWILVNSFGLPIVYFLSWNVIFPMLSLIGYDGTLSGPADSIVRGVLFGVVTGISLQWLLSHSKKNAETILPSTE